MPKPRKTRSSHTDQPPASPKQLPSSSYGADAIQVLEGLEPVRKRPGMYIGTTGLEGLHHLIWEVFDNARDEAMAGYASEIEVALLPGNRVRVADDGRGIPVEVHRQTKVSALETIMTTLHAGGKFGGGGYKVAGGLHGVGVSVVNALSTYLYAEVHRDGGRFVQEYDRGKPRAAVKRIGASERHGTIVLFEPDPEIFPTIQFSWKKIVDHLRQQAFLVPRLRIRIIDARALPEQSLSAAALAKQGVYWVHSLRLDAPTLAFSFEGGLRSMIRTLNRHSKPVHPTIFFVREEVDGVDVAIALQYVDDIASRILGFANSIYNPEGGTHITGFKTALTRTLNAYARRNNLLKEKDENLSGDDVLEGLTAAVSVLLENIQFEGQTKAKLGSVEARSAVETVFAKAFDTFLEEHPNDARAIIEKAMLAMRARKAAKAAKDSILRKGALEGMTLPGKLADCQTKRADEAELFIVEGDSAGGSAKQGRDRRTQAVLPMWGKILNVEKARLDKIVSARGIRELLVALGTGIGETFDISKLRYHKIIIATDADVDGAHIRTLFLTLFYRYLPQLIEAGHLYIAQPPLYKITKGKEVRYAYSEEEKFRVLEELGVPQEVAREMGEEIGEKEEGSATAEVAEEGGEATEAQEHGRTPKVSIQRYKGLGEMNYEELWETTMDPARRTLKQVTIEDARAADALFEILMGSDVASRKNFIQSNAKLAEIDV